MTGNVLAQLALPVLVYARTGLPLLSGLAFAASFLPYPFAAALLSALVDRVPPRRLLVGCDLLSALVVFGMAAPDAPDAALIPLAFVLGLIGPIHQGGRAATLLGALPETALVPGRSLIRLVGQGAQIGGFALTGSLLTVLTPRTLLVCDGVSFAMAAAVLRLGTRERAAPASRADPDRTERRTAERTAQRAAERTAGDTAARTTTFSVVRESVAGLPRIFRIPAVRRVLLCMWIFPALCAVPEALAVPYAEGGRPGGDVLGAGLLLTAFPVGTFIGETVVTWRASPRTQVRLIRASCLVLVIPLIVFASRPGLPAAIALLAVSGLGNAALPGLDRVLLAATPERSLPRVLSIQAAGLMFAAGAGYAVAGAAAEFLRLSSVIALAGCCGLVIAPALAPAVADEEPITRAARSVSGKRPSGR